MKVVFYGTAYGTSDVCGPVLRALHGAAGVTIPLVVTSPDAPVGRKRQLTESPVGQAARALGLRTVKPEKVRGNSELVAQLGAAEADIGVVVSYGKILPAEVLAVPRLGTVNVHLSLLPAYRGPSPVQAALKAGDAETGVTVFLLDELVDHGPVLEQWPVAIDPADTFPILAERLARTAAEKLPDILERYASGQLRPAPQDHDRATTCGLIAKADGRIDWSLAAEQIHNTWRAYQPWPGAWTTWNGKMLKVISCSLAPPSPAPAEPGTVFAGGLVAAGSGTALLVTELQMEGGSAQPFESFVRGYPTLVGSRLA